MDYIIRDSQSVVDFLYEIQSSYVNQAAVVYHFTTYLVPSITST